MEKKCKYTGRVYRKPNTDEVEFIGTVNADSIQKLKAKARQLAISWNKHGGRLLIECQNTQRQWLINSTPRKDVNAEILQSMIALIQDEETLCAGSDGDFTEFAKVNGYAVEDVERVYNAHKGQLKRIFNAHRHV